MKDEKLTETEELEKLMREYFDATQELVDTLSARLHFIVDMFNLEEEDLVAINKLIELLDEE